MPVVPATSGVPKLVVTVKWSAGAGETVRVAALVVTLPAGFVKTASYSLPLMLTDTLLRVSVVDVAPLIGLNVRPSSVLTCHCTVGDGSPEAAAVKLTLLKAKPL